SLVGQHLLQGWVLLAESCEKPSCFLTPMMQDHQGRTLCVLCQHDEEHGSSIQGEGSKSIPTPSAALSSQQEIQDKGEDKERRQIQRDMCTSRIGQHLLQGWTLLDTLCPNDECHGVPLIREPTGKECLCVVCSGKYLREADMSKDERAKAREDVVRTEQERHTKEEVSHVAAPPEERVPRATTSLSPSQASCSKPVTSPLSEPGHHLVPPKTLQVLSRQMSMLTEQLDAMPSMASPEEVTRRVQAVEACARAIRACQD
ncbi:hypothetical protein BJ684DRAFT_5292, partial [Piptocephalis cylindrospora]